MTPYGYLYLVRNRVSSTIYVGQTSNTVEYRWASHISAARSGTNNTYFIKAIRKYGPDAFDVIELGRAFSKDELDEMECRAIWTNESTNPEYGYNLMTGGTSRGRHSEETKARMSTAHKGKKKSAEHRAKLSAAGKGKKKSPDQIAKQCAAVRHQRIISDILGQCNSRTRLNCSGCPRCVELDDDYNFEWHETQDRPLQNYILV